MKFFNIKKWVVLGLLFCWSGFIFAQRGIFQPFSGTMNTQQQHYLQAATTHVAENGYQLIMLDINQLLDGTPVTLDFQNNLSIDVIPFDISKRLGGKVIWKGDSDQREGQAKFIINADLVTGGIRFHEARYRILPLTGGLHVLINQSLSQPKACAHESHHFDDSEPHHDSKKSLEENHESEEFETENYAGAASGSDCKIRVLVAYTEEAEAASADIVSVIETDHDDFNDINANSNVDYELEIARIIEMTGYTEVSSTGTHPIFGQLSNQLIRFQNNGDGFMDEIHNLRTMYDADMCHLYCTNLAGSGGIAYAISATASTAFCTSLWNNGSFTPSHEYGHLIGMRHNPENDPTSTPFAYGHGYHNDDDVTGSNFRTVMSYSNQCNGSCPVIPNWSNPSVNFMGSPTGTAAVSDNARVSRERDAIVAGFEVSPDNKSMGFPDTIANEETADMIAFLTIQTQTNAPIVFENGSTGLFHAQDAITLKEGFHGKQGCVFEGVLEMECTPLNFDENGSTNSLSSSTTENEVDQVDLDLVSSTANTTNETFSNSNYETTLKVYPNPFNDVTNIKYTVGISGRTELALYDIFGKKLKVLQFANLESGEYQYVLNATHLSAGTFYCVLDNEGEQKVQKIVLIK